MLFKTISITLPEEMIQKMDGMLPASQFASRSDFFRHLMRLWLGELEPREGETKIMKHGGIESEERTHEGVTDAGAKERAGEKMQTLESARKEFANVDCTFGIPANVVERIWEISKHET